MQVFVDETCRMEGRPLENLEQIEKKETCQFACFVLPECNYFLYDAELLDCELFATEDRSCDIVRGPPKPPINGCTGPATTTTTTTTEEPDTTLYYSFEDYE